MHTKRFFPGYGNRLFIWLVVYSVLMMGCVVGFQYHRERQFKSAELNARLQQINTDILEMLAQGNPQELRTHNFADLRVSVLDRSGHVLYDNSLDTLPKTDHRARTEIAQAMRQGQGYAVRRHSESTGGTYFYSAQASDRYVVRTAVPYSMDLVQLLGADWGFLWVIVGITLAMCVLGFFATRRIGRMAAMAEEHEKTRLKKQLTNNINHELKTPLASIQVCVETLLDHPEMDERNRLNFLKRCMTNVDRLRHLLRDVSTITRMDDGGAKIERENIDLTAIIGEVISDLEPKAAAKHMTVSDRVTAPVRIHANGTLMHSVFFNLVENAINYSEGTEVVVAEGGRTDRTITITVSDNGVGVDERHLPRIFERFYRIDKGRSRRAGGTGLGLAIVKNAVLIHGGTISVANRPTGGLQFTLTLRLA